MKKEKLNIIHEVGGFDGIITPEVDVVNEEDKEEDEEEKKEN